MSVRVNVHIVHFWLIKESQCGGGGGSDVCFKFAGDSHKMLVCAVDAFIFHKCVVRRRTLFFVNIKFQIKIIKVEWAISSLFCKFFFCVSFTTFMFFKCYTRSCASFCYTGNGGQFHILAKVIFAHVVLSKFVFNKFLPIRSRQGRKSFLIKFSF